MLWSEESKWKPIGDLSAIKKIINTELFTDKTAALNIQKGARKDKG